MARDMRIKEAKSNRRFYEAYVAFRGNYYNCGHQGNVASKCPIPKKPNNGKKTVKPWLDKESDRGDRKV